MIKGKNKILNWYYQDSVYAFIGNKRDRRVLSVVSTMGLLFILQFILHVRTFSVRSSKKVLLSFSLLLMIMLGTNKTFGQFPVVAGTNTSSENNRVTSHTVVLPTNIANGDLLLIYWADRDANSSLTVPAGWNPVYNTENNNYRAACYYKVANGAEGATVTITTSARERSTHNTYRVQAGTYTGIPLASAVSTGSSTAPNPPNLNTGSSADYLWIAASHSAGAATVNSAPTNFGDLIFAVNTNNTNNSNRFSIMATARRNLNASSINPDAFSLSQSRIWSAYTTVIQGFVTTSPPSCTTPASPTNGATDILVDGGLTWNSASGASGYYLYFGTDALATNIENGTDLGNVTSYTPSVNLNSLTEYYWKIVPYNAIGSATGCSIWSFTTGDVTYCDSYGNMEYNDGITLVNFNTINNVTGKPAGYNDYTDQSTNVIIGQSYYLTVNLNTDGNYTNQAMAWIDWNRDGEFTGTDESIPLGLTTNSTNGSTSLSPVSIQIPSFAVVGTTRMRVSTQWNQVPQECRQNFDGEVEDYSINVVGSCINATLTLTSGSENQSLCENAAISVIEYTVGGDATGASLSGAGSNGLTGVFNSGTYTISGTPTTSGSYTVTTTGTPMSCSEAVATGSITVIPLPMAPTANNNTTIYNGVVQTATASVGAGETVDWFTTETGTTSTIAPSRTDVGIYNAWAEARNTTTGCISATRTQVTLTISKKDLQVTATAPNISYGDAEPLVTVQYSGFAGSDDATVLDNTGFILGTNYTQDDPVGTYNTTILIGTATDNNYNFTPLNSSDFSVGKRVLTVTAGDQSVTYGTQEGIITQNGTYTISGFINGDNSSVVGGLGSISYSTNYTETSNAGSAGITITPSISGLSAADYNIVSANGSITINKADQFVSFGNFLFTLPLNSFDTVSIYASSSAGLAVDIALEPGSVADINFDLSRNPPYYLTNIGATGFVTFHASQAGNVNYNAANVESQTFDVTKTNQLISFPAINDIAYSNNLSINLQAVASSGLDVSYTVLTGPATVAGSTLSITGAGKIWLLASQAGDNSYNAASSVVQWFTVEKATQTITINIPAGTITESTQITATSTSGLPVTLTLGTGSAAASLVYNAGGDYYTLTGIGGSGNIFIVGNQAGDANYQQADQVIQTIDISKSNQTILFDPIANQTYSPSLTVSLSATASSGLSTTYTLVSGPASLSGSTLTITGAGTVVVEANQSGDGTYNAAPTVSQQFEVLKANPFITQLDITKSFGDAPFTISPSSTSTGSYSFVSGNNGIFTMSGNTATITGSGTTTLDITQQPTANYNGATKTVTFTVSQTPSSIVVTGSTNFTFNAAQQGPSTSTVTGSTGAITFSYLGTGSPGYGPTSTKPINAGTYTVTAKVAADENYSSATSVPYAFSISRADATFNITSYSSTYNGAVYIAVGTAEGVSSENLSGLNLSGTAHTNAGTYNNDPWTFVDMTGNYNDANGTINNIIIQKALTITALDQSKCFGETINFDGTEFSSSGLENLETIGSVTLTSGGAPAGAVAGTYLITPSNATDGTFNSLNYLIAYSDGELLIHPSPTLTNATQDATVCEALSATINLNGLQAGSTFNLDYSINNVAQTAITDLVADVFGNSSFTTPALTAANNGQVLQVTAITITSISPNCTQSFTQDVVLSVNPLPSLTSALQALSVCEGSVASINLSGLLANSTSKISYSINSIVQTPITGLLADGSGNSTFTTSVLTLSNDGQTLQIFEIEDESSGCSMSFTQNVLLEVDPVSVGGTATATDASICENSNTTIDLSGHTGTIQWQQSADGTTGWTNVSGGSGETSATYTTPDLTTNTYYRARVTSGACSAENSTVASVSIDPLPTLSNAVQSNPVCEGSIATVNLIGLLPNTTFTLIYTIDGGAFNTVTGLTADGSGNSSFSTLVLSVDNDGETLQIVEIEIENTACVEKFTQNVILNVDPISVAGTANVDQTICSGETPAAITLTDETGTIQWQSSVDNVTFNNIVGATSSPLTSAQIGSLNTTTYYRAVVSSGNCSSVNSNTITVTVNPKPAITLSSTEANVCESDNLTTFIYSGTSGTPNQYSIDFDGTAEGQGFVDVVNASLSGGTISVNVPINANPDTYNAVLTVRNSTTTCISATTDITVIINPLPNTGDISTDN